MPITSSVSLVFAQPRNWRAPFKFLFLAAEPDDAVQGTAWIIPLLLVALISMLVLWLTTPMIRPLILTARGASTLTPEQQGQAIRLFLETRYLSIAFTPISLVIKLLVAAWVTYMMAILVGASLNFRRIFTAFCIAGIVPVVRDVVIAVTLHFAGAEKLSDFTPPMGLDLLWAPPFPFWNALFSSITVFAVWQFAVLVFYLLRSSSDPLRRVLVVALPAGLLFPVALDTLVKVFAN